MRKLLVYPQVVRLKRATLSAQRVAQSLECFSEDYSKMYTDTNSAAPCGCDPGANHVCEWHRMLEKIPETVPSGDSNPSTNEEAPISPLVPPVEAFVVKDSGKRMEFESGMVRDMEEGKIDYSLVLDGPMFDRWAEHLTKGAVKYDARNWMKARGEKELMRFKRSALRHFIKWFRDEVDEDHGSGVYFNINGAEYVKALL